MKVTPLAGPNTGSADASTGQTGADRKEAAKAAFMGTTIKPADVPQDPRQLVDALNIRKIKMKTNASPDRVEEVLPEPESATPATNEQVEPEVTRPISPQFAALAKQKRALLVKEQEIAAREKALAEAPTASEEAYRAKLKANSLAELKAAGVTYESLTEQILAEQSGVDPRVQALEAKIDAIEKGLDTKLTERDAQAEKQVLAEISREAAQLVATDPDLELVRETKSQNKVTELIHRTWKTTGEVLDVQEAAKLVEDQLVEDGLKMTSFGKIRSRLAPEVVQTPAQKPYGLRTLTNRDTAQRPSSARARAIAAFNGTLKR